MALFLRLGPEAPERAAAWVDPVLSLCGLALLSLLVRRWRGEAVALGVLALLALVPAAVEAGALGNADHHVHEPFLAALCALLLGQALKTRGVALGAVTGAVLGLAPLLTTSGFVLLPGLAASLPVAAWLQRERVGAGVGRVGLALGVGNAGVLALGVALFGEPRSLAYHGLTAFAPLLALGLWCGASGLALLLERRRGGWLALGLAVPCAVPLLPELSRAGTTCDWGIHSSPSSWSPRRCGRIRSSPDSCSARCWCCCRWGSSPGACGPGGAGRERRSPGAWRAVARRRRAAPGPLLPTADGVRGPVCRGGGRACGAARPLASGVSRPPRWRSRDCRCSPELCRTRDNPTPVLLPACAPRWSGCASTRPSPRRHGTWVSARRGVSSRPMTWGTCWCCGPSAPRWPRPSPRCRCTRRPMPGPARCSAPRPRRRPMCSRGRRPRATSCSRPWTGCWDAPR
ncbi:hypothetical protein ACN28S_27870 [Cystobacter fuscus]